MPFENIKRGDKVFNQITFGVGDISILTSHERNDEYLSMIILSQHTEKPESEWEKRKSYKTTDDLDEQQTVILKFNKIKSIDMLIEALNDVKNSIQE